MAYKYRINANENSCDKCDAQNDRLIDSPKDLSFYTHPNCQCTTSRVSDKKGIYPKARMTKKARAAFNKENNKVVKKKLAKNSLSEEYSEENVFTHFLHYTIDPLLENEEDLIIEFAPDNITHNVMVSPFGEFKGYDVKSDSAIRQVLDKKTLNKLIANIDEDILIDIDHNSVKAPMERDTGAVGWATNFRVVDAGAECAVNGLYCDIKWTNVGKNLIKEKIYRFLSPTWILNEKNEPIKMLSIALTNKPALPLNPIMLNTEANDFYKLVYKETEMKILNEICEKLCLNTIADGEEITEEKVKEITDKVVEVKEKADNYDVIKEEEAKAEEAKKAAEAEQKLVDEFNAAIEGIDFTDESAKDKLFEMFKNDKNSFDLTLTLAKGISQKPVVENNEVIDENEVKEEIIEEVIENKEEVDDKDIATYEEVKSGEANKLKKKEVIDLEVLNSKPTEDVSMPSLKNKLKTLKGKDYDNFIRLHKDELLAEFNND